MNDHLSYPSSSSESAPEQPAQRTVLKERLYVGNLHPAVDEYSLLKLFSKYGKISKLDFLFHKAGPQKGKPRGYAFVEYENSDDALLALSSANEKLVHNRKLIVTYANQAPVDSNSTRPRKTLSETSKPTTLSMIKTAYGSRGDGTDQKIALMEAKLKQMENTEANSTLRHPLPAKPPAPQYNQVILPAKPPQPQISRPILPLSLPAPPKFSLYQSTHPSSAGLPSKPRSAKPSLLGVKIVKKNRKEDA